MQRAVALSLSLALWLATLPPAQADSVPPKGEWPVERNAQQLQQREWKIGLFGFDGGLHDRFQVGTLWLPWALLGFNAHAKALLVDRHGWHLGLEVTALHLNLEHLSWLSVDDVAGRLTLLPVDLRVDKQVHSRVLLGLGATYAMSYTTPEYDPQEFEGSGAYDNLLLHGHVTARASKRLWLIAELDWLLYQTAGAVGSVESQLDDFTVATGKAKAVVQPIDPGRGGAVTLSMLVRARRFGMRLGAGYGNLAVPRLGVLVPRKIPYVLFDIFARFGGKPPDDAAPPSVPPP